MTHARPGMRFTIDRAHVDRVTRNRTFLRRVYDLIIVHRRAILYAPAIDPFPLLRPMPRMTVTVSFHFLLFNFVLKTHKKGNVSEGS